jgi:hypothetical protein
MKTVISNKTGEALEIAKRIMYSLKVVTIGLFVPFLFVFGITYNTPKEITPNEINIQKTNPVNSPVITVDFNKPLPDQNS